MTLLEFGTQGDVRNYRRGFALTLRKTTIPSRQQRSAQLGDVPVFSNMLWALYISMPSFTEGRSGTTSTTLGDFLVFPDENNQPALIYPERWYHLSVQYSALTKAFELSLNGARVVGVRINSQSYYGIDRAVLSQQIHLCQDARYRVDGQRPCHAEFSIVSFFKSFLSAAKIDSAFAAARSTAASYLCTAKLPAWLKTTEAVPPRSVNLAADVRLASRARSVFELLSLLGLKDVRYIESEDPELVMWLRGESSSSLPPASRGAQNWTWKTPDTNRTIDMFFLIPATSNSVASFTALVVDLLFSPLLPLGYGPGRFFDYAFEDAGFIFLDSTGQVPSVLRYYIREMNVIIDASPGKMTIVFQPFLFSLLNATENGDARLYASIDVRRMLSRMRIPLDKVAEVTLANPRLLALTTENVFDLESDNGPKDLDGCVVPTAPPTTTTAATDVQRMTSTKPSRVQTREPQTKVMELLEPSPDSVVSDVKRSDNPNQNAMADDMVVAQTPLESSTQFGVFEMSITFGAAGLVLLGLCMVVCACFVRKRRRSKEKSNDDKGVNSAVGEVSDRLDYGGIGDELEENQQSASMVLDESYYVPPSESNNIYEEIRLTPPRQSDYDRVHDVQQQQHQETPGTIYSDSAALFD